MVQKQNNKRRKKKRGSREVVKEDDLACGIGTETQGSLDWSVGHLRQLCYKQGRGSTKASQASWRRNKTKAERRAEGGESVDMSRWSGTQEVSTTHLAIDFLLIRGAREGEISGDTWAWASSFFQLPLWNENLSLGIEPTRD